MSQFGRKISRILPELDTLQGRIQDFHLGGGGGARDYVPARAARKLRARNQTHFWQGSKARLRALEALGLC